jgi:hypothetical protein
VIMSRSAALLLVLVVTGCASGTDTPDRIPPDRPAPTVAESDASFTLDLLNMRSDVQVAPFVVELDGELLVAQQVPYSESPLVERLPLSLSPGEHVLVVSVGDYSITETIWVNNTSPRFLAAMYWGPRREGMSGPPIALTFSDEPLTYG